MFAPTGRRAGLSLEHGQGGASSGDSDGASLREQLGVGGAETWVLAEEPTGASLQQRGTTRQPLRVLPVPSRDTTRLGPQRELIYLGSSWSGP